MRNRASIPDVVYQLRTLWVPGARGAPFGIYELRYESEPYVAGGLHGGLRYLGRPPVLVLSDTPSTPGLILRYDYENDRIRWYRFVSASDTAEELEPMTPITTRVRCLAVYDFLENR